MYKHALPLLLAITLVVTLAVNSHAQSETATTQPAPVQKQALTADALLDQIETKAKTIRTYKAALRLEQVQGLLGDRQIRFGALYYVTEPTVKFAVDFQRIVIDGQNREQKRQWIYDGTWLVERLDDKKQFFKRQIHAPVKQDDPTQQAVDPMAMENNPFPIPLQAKKDEVLKRFDVTLVTDKSADDPNDMVFYHLKLLPKPSAKISFTQVDLWYDQATLLPVKCITVNSDSDDEQIYSLFKAELNEPLSQDILSTTAPTESGWHVEVTPLKQQHP